MANYILKVGDWYRYRRRVPAEVQHLDNRKEVSFSLKTNDFQTAQIRASIYNDQMENFWKSLVYSGHSKDLNEKYEIAVQLAQAYGFAYKTSEQIAASALSEITERLSVKVNNQREAEAILGGLDRPKILLSQCCEKYWPLITDRLVDKSKHQIRKWKNPRRAAMKNFIQVVGDIPLNDVSRRNILAFRTWWNEQIEKGLSANSANKQLMFIKDVMKQVALNNELDLEIASLFVDTSFKEKINSRPPFEASFVQNILLPGLKNLEDRYCYALFAMADTGMREREIFGLIQEDIVLNGNIPFIWIRPRAGYNLKTPHSERKIPLVGTALYAFEKFPKGFKQLGNPDTFSNVVNKYLTVKGLRPTPQHSAYSLRHTFKDRLRDAEAPEEIIDELMGHKKSGPKYGRGHRLETKYNWLNRIAYNAQNLAVDNNSSAKNNNLYEIADCYRVNGKQIGSK